MALRISVIEQEIVYVAFAGSKTGKPTPAFFEVVASFESQDTTRLKKVIINTFTRNSLECIIEKIVFFHQMVLL